MRRRLNASLAAVAVCFCAVMPAAAAAASSSPPLTLGGSGAGSSPFTPGVPQTPQTIPTQTAPPIINPSQTSSSGGLSSGSALAVGIGAIVILGGISLFIWRDARKRAPVRHSAAAAASASVPGSRRKPKARKLSAAERRRRKRGRAR